VTGVPRALRRTLVTGAALGAVACADLLVLQAVLAVRREYVSADSAPPVSGDFGDPADPTVRVAILGDSTAAGVGVEDTVHTVGGRLASLLAAEHLHIRLSGAAISGSRAGDLGPQVSRALLNDPHVAVVLIGSNDATHATPLARVRSSLVDAVRRCRTAGVAVVLGTCPDLGATRAVARPLRDVLAYYGRRVATTQADAGRWAGALVVDLAARTGPSFRADPQATLCADGFHPSAAGYDLWARALLPAVQQAIGIRVP